MKELYIDHLARLKVLLSKLQLVALIINVVFVVCIKMMILGLKKTMKL